MKKYKALAKTHEFNVEVSQSKIKNTEWWSGGTRLLQIFIAMLLVYRAFQYAIGFHKPVLENPEVFIFTQSWITAGLYLAFTGLWIWVIEKFRDKPINVYRITNEYIDGHKYVYTIRGLYENPSIVQISLSDLEPIDD